MPGPEGSARLRPMLTGAMTALVTPFRSGAIDEPALRALVDAQIAGGIDGLIACGTTGENPTLTLEEQARVVGIVVDAARGRVPVIGGAGSNSTAQAIQLAQACKEQRADALLCVAPYYNKPTQDGMYRHFRAIAEAARMPIVLYNVPGRTSSDLLPDTIARLCEVPEIVAVKEATGSLTRTQDIIRRCGDRIIVLSGDDATCMPLYAVGARGVISVLSNVVPDKVAACWDAAAAGDFARSRSLHYETLDLCDALFWEPNPVPTKAALAMMGRLSEELRAPLYPMTEAGREKLRGILIRMRLVQS